MILCVDIVLILGVGAVVVVAVVALGLPVVYFVGRLMTERERT